MVRDAYNVDPNIRLILKANQDEWIRNVDEAMELCDNAQKILDKDAISNSVNVRQDEYYKPNYRDIDCGYVGKRGIGYMG
jgi:hypothetical protein